MFDYSATSGEIFLYDAIGSADWGMIDAGSVRRALMDIGNKQAVLHVNSPGGSVDEASAIIAAMEEHKPGVAVIIDSLAASAASYIAMAGQSVAIASGGMMMIHSPMTIAFGNARDLRKAAEVVDKYEDTMVARYKKRMKASEDEIRQMLADETWFTSAEAIEAGLADPLDAEAVEPMAVPEAWFRKTPEALLGKGQPGRRTRYNPAARRWEIASNRVIEKFA